MANCGVLFPTSEPYLNSREYPSGHYMCEGTACVREQGHFGRHVALSRIGFIAWESVYCEDCTDPDCYHVCKEENFDWGELSSSELPQFLCWGIDCPPKKT